MKMVNKYTNRIDWDSKLLEDLGELLKEHSYHEIAKMLSKKYNKKISYASVEHAKRKYFPDVNKSNLFWDEHKKNMLFDGLKQGKSNTEIAKMIKDIKSGDGM